MFKFNYMDKKTLLKLFLIFIPVAYATYLFHEFGHWIVGELLGNEMTYSLNYVTVKNGQYIAENHKLLSSIGGPLFTILQSFIFLLVIKRYKTIYVYPFVFFAFFTRFFSLVFGGFERQDEAVISASLEIGKYTVAIFVILTLFLMVSRASKKLEIDLKHNGIFYAISTFCVLIVIGTYKFIF